MRAKLGLKHNKERIEVGLPTELRSAGMHCLLDDVGLSVGLVSLPLQQEQLFFDREIAPIFSDYSSRVRGFFRTGDSLSLKEFDSLYRPMPYYLFGRFDMALLYLVDDHDFSCRTLRPFHPSAPGGDDERAYAANFNYKVLFGPTPRFSRGVDDGDGLIGLVGRIQERPLIALTQLKLNNSLLVGGGVAFLRLVIRHIKSLAGPFEQRGSFRLIILESYAWHEVTLVMLGPSYAEMLDLVNVLRDLSYRDLVRKPASGTKTPDDEEVREFGRLTHLLGPDIGWSARDVEAAPLFGALTTNLGFDFRMFQRPDLLMSIDPKDRIHLISRWFVKPGRLNVFKRLVVNRSKLLFSVGRGDVWSPADALDYAEPTSTRKAIATYIRLNTLPHLSNAALQRYTFAQTIAPKNPRRATRRRGFSDQLRKIIFSGKELKEIHTCLRRLRIPNVLIHRLTNVFANFNDCVLDRSLYSSFAELRPFLERVASELGAESKKPLPNISNTQKCDHIRTWVVGFERGHRNRFHNSEKMGEVTDFNLEFKGGIQQVMTAFDAAYKAISSVLGAPGGFASVGGEPGVESTRYEVRLNYFHVFQPEMFFAVAGKEAANFFVASHEHIIEDKIWLQAIKSDLRAEILHRRGQWLRKIVHTVLRHRDISDAVRKEAKSWISVGFLQNHFSELLTLEACYAGNWDLFSYWALGVFLQTPDVYRHDGRLDSQEVARFLFRLRMLAGRLSEDEFGASIKRFGDDDILDVYVGLEHTSQLALLRERVVKHPVLGAWFRKARWRSEAIAASALADGQRSAMLSDLQQRARAHAEAKRDEFAEGRVPRFEPSDPAAPFRFCQHVLYGYLLLLKEQWGNKAPRLGRAGPNASASVSSRSSSLSFDPAGGVFAHEAETRRRLFKYRSAVTMTLWDLGLKMKRDQLAQRMAG
jgi:hypothetical protein